MYYNNPFGAWAESSSASGASVFGALPYPTDPANLQTFYFTNLNPTIFNSTVVGPRAQPCYQVATDAQNPGYTVIKNAEGRSISLIEWQQHPYVEVRGIVSKRAIGSWLRLSASQE
ncbi:hypothetical protein CC1G_11073 [Coprinopsis cinerea okayama7|uniref:Uncharacterized protein n=1 Tax=Coprinopsis cinerea (strain Okayama-7 / 130 / ATCC MYA-4618 / FGSC 9003) TaxID=240176 RepID=A8NCA4_COPC7|nr:hypothetical protein CC1G_11073 [Coprinopsis cinerea okayama7\|eukprot:XP_001832448.2 hypothetical protein CC1G_11073 [Coprinopsis cinerea okayama7\